MVELERQPSLKDHTIGRRIYEGLKPGQPQPLFNAIVAIITLTIYGTYACMPALPYLQHPAA